MSDSGHPARHGYRQCARCGTWRRAAETRRGLWAEDSTLVERDGCTDWAWCEAERRRKAVVSETAPEAGWDANGAPIEMGGEL
jgi:hypothetical protein